MIIRRDTSNRRQQIAALLQEHGSVQITSLAEVFNVSTQTLRKDLNFLDSKGICTRSPGGALLHSGSAPPREDAVDVKRTLFAPEKVRIGQAAAKLIEAGDSILLDSGSTTLQVARHIKDEDSLVVVTNDVGILNELVSREHTQVVFLGGSLRRKSLSFYGLQTERALQELHVDKLFLAADGFDIEPGITTHFEPEAVLNRLMCNCAREIIAVADSSKFGRVCLHKVLEPQRISKLVTDAGIPGDAAEALAAAGVEVIIA
jgi:DeoR family transcriptional regulator, aga operon transcriptional repressor